MRKGSFYTNFHQNFLQCWVSPPLNSVFKPGFEPTTSHTVNHCPSATLAGQLPNLLPRCSPKNCFDCTVITRPRSNPTLAFVLVWGAQCIHLNGDQTPCHSLFILIPVLIRVGCVILPHPLCISKVILLGLCTSYFVKSLASMFRRTSSPEPILDPTFHKSDSV